MANDQIGMDLVSRAGIRAGTEDNTRLLRESWTGWLADQLAKPSDDEPKVRDALQSAKLKIEYGAEDGLSALSEERHLSNLDRPIAEVWHLSHWEKKIAWEERIRPAREVTAATILRATLSTAQLREVAVDFWRDHFSVNWTADEDVAISLPTYDRDVIRPHTFGNFREMLEAVATSTAMLSYLNNATSRASPANENYARELLELHTLGANVYLNEKFDRWREVPGALQGAPTGYIDQDVYETARAFTGWTYADGQYVSEGVEMARTGIFSYTDAWHDPYQKRLLATEFDAHLPPMMDGQKALDLMAFHPATARHIAFKLCQRFVADVPPASLVDDVSKVFVAHSKAKDQIAQTLRAVLLSSEFASATPRLQRPLFLLASLQRSSGVVLAANIEQTYMLEGMGQRLYSWHTPAGHPAHSGYWQSPGLMVRRWRMMAEVWRSILAQMPQQEWGSFDAFTQYWAQKLLLGQSPATQAANLMRKEYGETTRRVSLHPDERWITVQALSLLSASPNYQSV